MSKYNIVFLFYLLINLSFSQTKAQLIDSLIKVNQVEFVCDGLSESKQYENFQQLKYTLSDNELIKLTKHKHPVVRAFTLIELIEAGKGNITELFSYEIKKNEKVETIECCLIDEEDLSSIIYNEYWNKIQIDDKREFKNDSIRDLEMKKLVTENHTMKKLDSIAIYSKQRLYGLLYNQVFENRRYYSNYLPKIKDLIFNNNVHIAYEYLKQHHKKEYGKKLNRYLIKKFPKAKFNNDLFSLSDYHSFIEILLDKKTKKHNKIVIDKLRNDTIWKKEENWFLDSLKESNIEL